MNKSLILLSTAVLTLATAHAQTAMMMHGRPLHSLGAPTTGQVSAEEKAGQVVVTLTDLKTEPGPDLQVWLYTKQAPAKGATDAAIVAVRHVKVGALKTFNGTFTFKAPAGTKLADYKSVVLYCAVAKTAFAAGDLK